MRPRLRPVARRFGQVEANWPDPRQVIIVNIRPALYLFLCALFAAAPIAAETYYKWTDENGTVHFAAQPPADQEYETVNTSGRITGGSPAPANTPPPTGETEEAQVQMPREAAPDPEVVEARCQPARENRFWLQSKRRIIVENDDGGETFIDAEEQQRLIEENQALIDEWCGNGP